MEHVWSELQWFVSEDPDVVRALVNLGEIDLGPGLEAPAVYVTREDPAPREGPTIVDAEALLRELRTSYPDRVAPDGGGASDPLRAYLQDLDTRELPLVRAPVR